MKAALERVLSERRWVVDGDPLGERHTYEAIARDVSPEDAKRIAALGIGKKCTVCGCVVVRVA